MNRLLPMIVLGVFFLSSCVNDELEECLFPLHVKFSYTQNLEKRDLLREEVSQISLFIYETPSGRLHRRVDLKMDDLDQNNSTTLMLKKGDYRLISWSYSEDNPLKNNYLTHEEGNLNLANLNIQPNADNVGEQLWYQKHSHVKILGAEDIAESHESNVELDLCKYSNDVRIEIEGLKLEDAKRLVCNLEAGNSEYSFSHGYELDKQAPYLYTNVAEYGLLTSFSYTTLRLKRNDDSKLLLYLRPQSISGEIRELYSGSLSELLLLKYAELDIQDEFVVRFEYQDDGTYSHYSIYVNDWLVIENNESLQ